MLACNVGVQHLRASPLRSALCTLAVSEAADLQAAVHRDETGGEQRADAKHKALDAVAEAARLSKHPGVAQADGDRAGFLILHASTDWQTRQVFMGCRCCFGFVFLSHHPKKKSHPGI